MTTDELTTLGMLAAKLADYTGSADTRRAANKVVKVCRALRSHQTFRTRRGKTEAPPRR